MPNSKDDKFDLDSNLVRKLAKLLEETGLGEIEYAEGDRRIRLATPAVASAHGTAAPPAAAAPTAGGPAPAKEASLPPGLQITAPMVGTVYLAPEPSKPPFVKKGDAVKEGDTLLIIEAMKVMNQIKAPKDGTIAEVLAVDSAPVEFGETLMVIG
jgi:acetyl-CoA carboxylase biotin carboxyl carrier protein